MIWNAAETLLLSVPFIAGQLVQMLPDFADTAMVGRLGAVPLAAMAFANSLITIFFVFGIGLLSAISILVSREKDHQNKHSTLPVLWTGLVIAFVAGCLFFALIAISLPWLGLFHPPREVLRVAPGFLLLLATSIIPGFLGVALRNYSEAIGYPWPSFWITTGGILLNVALNWLWIYGNWGFPAWGIYGAGCATLVARVAIATGLIVFLFSIDKLVPEASRLNLSLLDFKTFIAVGLPAGGQIVTEVGTFGAAGMMMGWLGTTALAAHQVALTCNMTLFMLPLGISVLATLQVGRLSAGKNGTETHETVARFLYASIMATGIVTVLLWPLAFWIVRFFVQDPAVAKLSVHLLHWILIFQVANAIQIVMIGLLRGMADLTIPLLLSILSYVGVTLSTAYLAAFVFKSGAVGIWLGLGTGMSFLAASLLWRLRSVQLPIGNHGKLEISEGHTTC